MTFEDYQMDIADKILIGISILVFVFSVIVVSISIVSDLKYETACNQRGGVMLRASGMIACVDPNIMK
jgi:hypothetical protein